MNELARIKTDTKWQIIPYMHQKQWSTQVCLALSYYNQVLDSSTQAIHIYIEG